MRNKPLADIYMNLLNTHLGSDMTLFEDLATLYKGLAAAKVDIPQLLVAWVGIRKCSAKLSNALKDKRMRLSVSSKHPLHDQDTDIKYCLKTLEVLRSHEVLSNETFVLHAPSYKGFTETDMWLSSWLDSCSKQQRIDMENLTYGLNSVESRLTSLLSLFAEKGDNCHSIFGEYVNILSYFILLLIGKIVGNSFERSDKNTRLFIQNLKDQNLPPIPTSQLPCLLKALHQRIERIEKSSTFYKAVPAYLLLNFSCYAPGSVYPSKQVASATKSTTELLNLLLSFDDVRRMEMYYWAMSEGRHCYNTELKANYSVKRLISWYAKLLEARADAQVNSPAVSAVEHNEDVVLTSVVAVNSSNSVKKGSSMPKAVKSSTPASVSKTTDTAVVATVRIYQDSKGNWCTTCDVNVEHVDNGTVKLLDDSRLDRFEAALRANIPVKELAGVFDDWKKEAALKELTKLEEAGALSGATKEYLLSLMQK